MRLRTIEKISVILALFLLFSAVMLTVTGNIAAAKSPVILEQQQQPQPAANEALIDINTAGEDELCTLPGIGPAISGRIIEYREEHGGFSAIADIMDVKGIGLNIFENIKEKITVS